MKRKVLILVILLAIIILFRGWIYRQLVTYKAIGTRQQYVINDAVLIDFIEKSVKNKFKNDKNVDIQSIIQVSLAVTAEQLNFTAANNHNDPNKLIYSKTAHCVGYASFFTSTCNYLLKKYALDEQWQATPHIGQLYLLGANVHRYISTPFFKDHDFVVIENKVTKMTFTVDPTVNDYWGINFVTK